MKTLCSSVYYDTHFHLDLHKDPQSIANKLACSDISVIAVTNAPFVYPACLEITKDISNIETAIGLHPELAAQYKDQIGLFHQYINKTRFIGEVGLDYVKNDLSDRAIQRKVFEDVIEIANQRGDTFMTVHSRRAASDVIAMFGSSFKGTVVLHWFSGNVQELISAIDAGMYFSVNPAMLLSDKGKRLVSKIPKERVLTETDGPFVQVQKRPAEPQDVKSTVSMLAGLWMEDHDVARERISMNFACALQCQDAANS